MEAALVRSCVHAYCKHLLHPTAGAELVRRWLPVDLTVSECTCGWTRVAHREDYAPRQEGAADHRACNANCASHVAIHREAHGSAAVAYAAPTPYWRRIFRSYLERHTGIDG